MSLLHKKVVKNRTQCNQPSTLKVWYPKQGGAHSSATPFNKYWLYTRTLRGGWWEILNRCSNGTAFHIWHKVKNLILREITRKTGPKNKTINIFKWSYKTEERKGRDNHNTNILQSEYWVALSSNRKLPIERCPRSVEFSHNYQGEANTSRTLV